MSNFMELDLPLHRGEGRWCMWSLSAGGDGLWYSLIADGSGNLKAPRGVEELNGDHMFNTEQEVHVAANHYYFNQGRTYPYMSEWAATVDTTKVSGSRVMEFA